MLFQVLLNIIVAIIKFAMWVLVALVAIPFGIYMFLLKYFLIFTHDAGFWFWSVFSILSIIGFVLLWRPIMWIVGGIQLLGAGQ